ncbi:MAG: TolC family protein [Rubrivivax sp.]
MSAPTPPQGRRFPATPRPDAPAEQPFLWPDENPPEPGWRERLHAWVRNPAHPPLQAPTDRPSSRLPRATAPKAAGVRWRLRDAIRTRPLPTAVALAIGIGPLAFAAYHAFPDTSDLLALEPTSGVPAGSAADNTTTATLRSSPAAGDTVWPGADATPPEVPVERLAPPVADAPTARREAQWGDPLPSAEPGRADASSATGARPVWQEPAPVQPPDTPRRTSGRVVLASSYWASRGWAAVAETDAQLAQAAAGTATAQRAEAPPPARASGYQRVAFARAGTESVTGLAPGLPPSETLSLPLELPAAATAATADAAPADAEPVAVRRSPSSDAATDAPRGLGRLVAWAKSLFGGRATAPATPVASATAAAVKTVPAAAPVQMQPEEPPRAPGVLVASSRLQDGVLAVREQLSSAEEAAGKLAKNSARELRETSRVLNPFAAGPRLPAVPAADPGAIVDPLASRALRIAELPVLLSLHDTLPVDERSNAPLPTPALSLEAAVDKGLRRHPEVEAARARYESFRHTTRAALGALLPQAEGRAAVGTGTLTSVSPSETRHRKEGTFTVRQTLLDVAATREHSRQSALQQAAELQWQASVSNVSQEIASNYLQALQARITLTLAARHVRELARVLEIVTERANGGGTSQAERSRVQARVASARAQMADARATLRGALRRLSVLTGDSPSQLAMDLPASLDIPPTVEAAMQDVDVLNRDLLASHTEAKASAFEALSYRARVLPKLELEMTHTRATNPGGAEAYTRDTRAMVVLNWQLYSGGSDMAQQRAALEREREREYRGQELRLRLAQDLEAAYASLESVTPRFAALREELAANVSVAAAFNTQLVNGNRPLLDVLDTYQRLHANRLGLASLVLGEVQNHVRVAHMTGRLGVTALASMHVRSPSP